MKRSGPDLVEYPTSDGKPMAESDTHRNVMCDLIQTLQRWFANEKMVHVSGNILVYYQQGNPRRRVAPDVLVVKGVRTYPRDNYLVWNEGKSLDLVIEVTSRATRKEDLEKKFALYRDVLTVSEYFLFDPRAEYLDPPLQGYHRVGTRYVCIRPVQRRLPSQVTGLHLERQDLELRFYDPARDERLLTLSEQRQEAEAQTQVHVAARREAEAKTQVHVAARRKAEVEIDRLRREIAALRQAREQLMRQVGN